ncbi:hypothetical protein CGCF245_v005917 [Colletotrichum fructicola]|nr:hypothetical protein CGCF245_v005917 [Colletotrichum fructicola]
MRRDLLEMFLDDAGGFEKCLGLQYASHDAGIEDSIRNPDPLLDRMGPITDRLFSLSLADEYDYGGKLGARIKAGGFAGEAMPHPQISLQESVFGLSCREDGVLQRSNDYGLVAPEERRPKAKTQSTAKYDASSLLELKLQLPRRPAAKQQHQSVRIKPEVGLLDGESQRSRPVADLVSETTAVPSHNTTQQDNQEESKEPAGLPKPSVSLPANDTGDSFTGETSSPRQKFACPYLQKDPATWGQRPKCRGPSFATIHRLNTFPTQDEVNIHIKSKSPCELSPDIIIRGFDVAQREKLRCKKRSWGKSGQEKWEDIFRILFPDCKEIPDPYYNHNFDGVAPDPTTAGKKRPLDIESVFTDGLAQELEEEKRKKVMQVVETLVIKVLQQPQVAKNTKSGEALVETPEDARSYNEQQTAESNAKSFPSDSTPPTQAVRPVAAPEVGVDSHDLQSRAISGEALVNIPEDEGNAWLSTEFYDFDFGDESNLQRWPGGSSAFVEGIGYEWAAVSATAFRVPCWSQTLDYTPAQGDGNFS